MYGMDTPSRLVMVDVAYGLSFVTGSVSLEILSMPCTVFSYRFFVSSRPGPSIIVEKKNTEHQWMVSMHAILGPHFVS